MWDVEFTKKLVFKLALIFLVIILVMTLGLGLPAMLLISRQTNQQMQTLIDQTTQSTQILLENKENELQNFGLLISDRPTLNKLLEEGQNQQEIRDYLETILINAQADLIAICRQNDIFVSAGNLDNSQICYQPSNNQMIVLDHQAWWFSRTIMESIDDQETMIVVGQQMDSILEEFNLQTDLVYYLYYEGVLLSSNRNAVIKLEDNQDLSETQTYDQLTLKDGNGDNQNFMAALVPLSNHPGFRLIGLLNVETNKRLEKQIRNYDLIIIAIVTVAGILSAVILSRQISKPMNQLASSAKALQEGDFSSRLTTKSKIWEINQLANTLEDARVALKHSLDQLRNDKNWMEALLNSIVESIITIDDQARVTYSSAGLERILDIDPVLLLGKPLDQFFISPNGEDLFSHQIPFVNQNVRIPVIINQREILLSVSTTEFIPPEAGNATRALVLRDVTDEERIHRLMGDFIANITHEFRTPLTALSASVELLLDQLPELSNEEIKTLLHALNVGIINLQTLIDNLIEAASIEGGRFKVNPKPVEFQAILDDAVNIISPILATHKLNLVNPQIKQNYVVLADRRRTSQVLVNLLANAIKHSPKDGNIFLTTVILGKEVMVEIIDEGVGIPQERQQQLFNRFITPAKDDDSSQVGLGLGLSVVKAIVEAQNGTVGFREGENGGAIFWFTLPILSGSNL